LTKPAAGGLLLAPKEFTPMAKPVTSKVKPTDVGKPYDARGCASLLLYGKEVHLRSGGICQLCQRFGVGDTVDFESWRQLTVEHIIGRKDDGSVEKIRDAVEHKCFDPPLSPGRAATLADELHRLNTVSACSFCNSMTSRATCEETLAALIARTKGSDAELVGAVTEATKAVLSKKQAEVRWKLESLRAAFNEEVATQLADTRKKTVRGEG
jgi:hypothetical protein